MGIPASELKPLYDHMIQFFPKGKCITFLLNRVGHPATQIAKENSVNITYLSHMINGTREVTPVIKSAICAALHFDPWDHAPPTLF